MRLLQLTWTLSMLLACVSSSLTNLSTIYEWKYIDYVWDNDTQKDEAVQSGRYDYTKIITKDVQQLPDGSVLITTPKYCDNPASLSTVSSESGDGGPLLKPYPSWDWHKEAGDCSGITSVNRVSVDKCNRLWVVDSGKIGNEQVCSAKIFVFDATTAELLKQVVIPDDISHNPNDSSKGRLEMQVVETVGDTCEQTWAYIGDPEGWGLVIYNDADSKIWRLNDDIYAPVEGSTEFNMNDANITLNLGLAVMELPPAGFMKENYILFKPMAAKTTYAAIREQLHNSYSGIKMTYYKSNYSLSGQEVAKDYSSDGISIGGFPTGAFGCWNLEHPLVDPYVVTLVENIGYQQFISSVKITEGVQNGVKSENSWVMTSLLYQFISNTTDFTKSNFRVLGANVATLVSGTNCQPTTHSIVDGMPDKFFFEI